MDQSVEEVEVIQAGGKVHIQGPLLGGGREGVHRPYKLELNMLTLEQVYHVT